MVEPGATAAVRVAVATLWDRPENVRPVDAAALRAVTDIRGWVAGLDAEERLGDCVLSQLLLGERVLVDEVRDDGWARVVAVEQPSPKLDPRGYPGWMPVAHLTLDDAAAGEEVVVDATAVALRDSPDGDVALPGVVIGTRLAMAGPPSRGWLPVSVPGQDQPLWALVRDLAPIPTGPPSAEDALAVAARFLDVPYVWGGVSAYGIDCSGLIHLAWRRCGVRLPRDAGDQAGATTPLAPGDERPGDLYVFARPGRTVHHIGFVAAKPNGSGGRRVLHACYSDRRVVDEPVAGERAANLVAAHRVTAARPAPATARSAGPETT